MKWFQHLAGRAEAKIVAGSSVAYGLLIWLLPWVALTLAGAALVVTLALIAGRIACAARSTPAPERTDLLGDDFVSIHIATYSEPPEVVCRTLDALARLDYRNFEVIVLDNNTPDANLYEPVRDHCRKLGPKFRFFHYDNVEGAKAGALNISLGLANRRTEFILVLDADYQAEPGIIPAGLGYFVDSTVGLVQFPQAYRNSSDRCGLSWEYKSFFDVYMNQANLHNTVLSTGTVSFVRRGPLEASGGWSGETLTEDAELGLRLHRHGFRGVYVPEVAAAGVMPTDLASLRAQRRRWVLGNAQSLSSLYKEDLSLGRKALLALQLTAWASPLLLSLVTLLIGAGAVWLDGGREAHGIVALSALSIVSYLGGMFAFFALAVTRQGGHLGTATRAYLVHLGMLWEASVCWCELFVKSDKSFVRTDKFIHAPEMVSLGATLAGSLAGGIASINILWHGGSPTLAFCLGLLSVVVLGQGFLRWNLHEIRSRTVRLAEFEEKQAAHFVRHPSHNYPAEQKNRRELLRAQAS